MSICSWNLATQYVSSSSNNQNGSLISYRLLVRIRLSETGCGSMVIRMKNVQGHVDEEERTCRASTSSIRMYSVPDD